MPRAKKMPAKQPAALVPDASLLGIAPELRNNIYHLVAQDIDEVSFIGRKISFGAAGAEDRLWATVAKHPLSQTCTQLRREFDPIHRHKAITTGAPHYNLELQNYDVDRIGGFARLLNQAPIILPHLRLSATASRSMVHFHLDQNAKISLDKIEQDLNTVDRLRTPFLRLRELLIEEPEGSWDRYDWWNQNCTVSFKLRYQSMPTTEKEVAITQNLARAVKDAMDRIGSRYCSYYRSHDNSDHEYAGLLHRTHMLAHDVAARELKKDKLRLTLKAELTEEIRGEVEIKMRKRLRLSLKKQPRVPKVRQCLGAKLREELKVELRDKIGNSMDAEVRDELSAEKQARREKEKESFRKELRQELKEELIREIRSNVETELRKQLKEELMDEIRSEVEAELTKQLKVE